MHSANLGGTSPSRNTQPKMPIPKLAAISPQTIHRKTLLHGYFALRVCFMDFRTESNPKPRVNPAASDATLKSVTVVAMM